jgi:Fic family protein
MVKAARNKSFELTEAFVLKLHKHLYQGVDPSNAGKYRTESFFYAPLHLPLDEQNVPYEMKRLVTIMRGKVWRLHPVYRAAYLHWNIVKTYPFRDGNEPVARLLMNLILINCGYYPAIIPPECANEYLVALRQTINRREPRQDLFHDLITQCVYESQKRYCHLLEIPIDDILALEAL